MTHDYWIESLVIKDRFARIQAFFETQALLRSLRPPRRPVLRDLGMALIRVGRWILRHVPAWVEDSPGPATRPAPPASRGS